MQVWELFQGVYTLFLSEPKIAVARVVLIALGFLLIYLGYRKTLEPIIMIPMGIGMVSANAGIMVMEAGRLGSLFLDPMASNTDQLVSVLQINFLQPIFTFTFSNGLIACLIFMGIGAITDIDFLVANPFMNMWLAMWAELGTILTVPIALMLGLLPREAAAVALVGGADGPMVLFGSIMLAKDLFVPIAIVAYVYLSVCYAGYPLLIKLLIPKRLRGIEMDRSAIPRASPGAKFAFVIITGGILSLLFPVAAPLFASFFVGLAVRQAGITRYVEFLSGPLLYGASFFLAFTLGALMGADIILNTKVLLILILGMVALLLSGVGGLVGALIYRKFSKKPVNPLIGIAAVSCVPTTVKVAQKMAAEANPRCMILPFAIGPNIAGVITTAIITGIYVSGIKFIG